MEWQYVRKLFLPLYYQTVYPGIDYSGLSPFEHYMTIGWKEGKNPNPFMYSNWYLRHCPEAEDNGISPLEHFFLYGDSRGNDPSPRFSVKAYRALYPETWTANSLLHYFQQGLTEGYTHILPSVAEDIVTNCVEAAANPGHAGLRAARPFLSRLGRLAWREFAEAVNTGYPKLAEVWRQGDYRRLADITCDLAFNHAKLEQMIVHGSRPIAQAGFAHDPLAQAVLINLLLGDVTESSIAERKKILDSADEGWRKHPVVRYARTLLEFAEGNLDWAMRNAYGLSAIPGYMMCYHDLNILGHEIGFVRGQSAAKHVLYADFSNHFCHIPFKAFTFEQSKPYLMGYLCCAGWQPFSVEPKRDVADISFAESHNSPMAQEIRRSILDGDFTYCARSSCLAIYDRFGEIHHDHSEQAAEIASAGDHVSMIESAIAGQALLPRDKITDESDLRLLQHGSLSTMAPPKYISILLDASCNIVCPSCRNERFRISNDKANELAVLYDREIYPLLRSGHKCDIEVDGSGEALFSPLGCHILKGINPELTPGTRVTLRTNGLLLSRKMWYEILGETRKSIGHVRVSIDGGNKEVYEKLRFPGKWETITANMEFMGSLVAGGELKSLTLCAIIRGCSWESITNLAELGKIWNVESLTLLRYLNKTTTDVDTFDDEDVLAFNHPSYAEVRRMIANVSDYCRNNGIRLILRCSG